MNEIIDSIVATAATTLTSAMVTDLWADARLRIGQIFGRGDTADTTRTMDDLADSHRQLQAAPADRQAEIAHDVRSEWRGAIRSLVGRHPEALDELRQFVSDFSGPVASASRIGQQITLQDQAKANIAGRDQINFFGPAEHR
ncbi:hypothetical protein GCM10027280_12110 [Micromonospora polyrhachis]|uniref:Uncharacterized protein n=1 Tax=Micromonospora polyrhachis TaxID=1282883 RepID=A0A7W7SSD0_9ACTN|nr:hypothetical protein [Micromonospora polyrhachis]MBB4959946.1 hypothetical protein [Micromonospora polyrhachis]